MGMWRTVQVNGQIKGWKEIDEITAYLTVDKRTYDSPAFVDDVFFLQFGSGICGLNKWINTNGQINAVGNVYERDCTVEDLEKELNIIASKFPTLDLELHAGDDYESSHCICTFRVSEGKVEKLEPQITDLNEISQDQMMKSFFEQLIGN